ncbi:MAG: citrate transporter [Firmicutes bacterium]|nr:citrate transporter [Bacillota bacterium]
MTKFRSFLKREPVLCIAALAAVVSSFFVPPDAQYARYIDFRTLALLYCLMTVVAGFSHAGLFSYLAFITCRRAANTRSLGLLLILLSFFSAMVITNDVALITFVPFAVLVLGMAGQPRALILVVVLQTVAANLGSMLTPVGNPQNLYLYSYYGLAASDFVKITLPFWLASLVLLAVSCLLLKRDPVDPETGQVPHVRKGAVGVHLILLLVCLLVVLRILPWPVMLAAVILILLPAEAGTLVKADFYLLLTFVFFFIFSGNLARIEAVRTALQALLAGREYLTALLASQVISNVPAALLLSGFTDAARELLLGVDVGGLGTPIASLASLISLKLYSQSKNAAVGRYLLVFTAFNLVFLLALSLLRLAL